MTKISTILVILFLGASLNAQNTWTLEKCINQALANSLNMKQSELSIAQKAILLKQSKAARLPNLSGSISFFEQFGRTIDPTTNTFANKKIGSSQFSLSSGVLLFNAGRINHTIAQAKLNLKASEQDAKNVANDLSLNVALIYLQILFAEDQVKNANDKLTISKEQLKRAKALIQAGSLAANESLTFEAQLAVSEQSVIQSQSTLDNAYLQLKQLLRLDTEDELKVSRPDILIEDVNPDLLNTEMIYQQALSSQANIQAGKTRLKSSELGEKIAKSQLYPTLSLSGSLSSNYSTLSRKLDGTDIATLPQQVKINGTPALLEIPQIIPKFSTNPFGNQLNENFGEAIGLRLNIPIYQNGRTSASVQQAKIATLQTRLKNEQVKQNLKSNIQKAISDARSAKRQYSAAEKSARATQAVYLNTQQKYDIGGASSFELTTAKNNADVAKTNLTSAQYDYLFKLKVIDYYQGKKIQF